MRSFLLPVLLLLGAPTLRAQALVERPEWRAPFDSAGVEGTIAVRRVGGDTTLVHAAARARRGYLPASTFKIPNSVIALELGVARDESHPFPMTWPPQAITAWNRDHTLRTALTYSVVPAYQQIAQAVGEARYRDWLARFAYGNADPSGGLTTFWLDGALRISALEQLDFLERLVQLELPASERSQRIVHAMLVTEANACWRLHAKTGLLGISATRAVDPVGWYVGWVETDGARWVFAMNIDTRGDGASAARIPITKSVLGSAGILAPCGR